MLKGTHLTVAFQNCIVDAVSFAKFTIITYMYLTSSLQYHQLERNRKPNSNIYHSRKNESETDLNFCTVKDIREVQI
jgi:hypothetical protein